MVTKNIKAVVDAQKRMINILKACQQGKVRTHKERQQKRKKEIKELQNIQKQ